MEFEKEFKDYLIKDKNASDSTMNAYFSDINEFTVYLSENRRKTVLNATGADITSYMMNLKDSGKSTSTINRKMSSVRCYYSMLSVEGKIHSNPAQGIKSPKTTDKNLEFLTVEEIDTLLSLPDDTPKGMRDKALLELMYATGMRASEITSANFDDVDLRIGFITCREGRGRIVPMGKPARAAVQDYLTKARSILTHDSESSQALFVNFQGERITRQGVWKIIKYYGEKSGIQKTFSPQILRNSFAVHMLQNGADLKSVQDLMGLEDINAAKLYMVVSKRRIMDVYDKTHPRA